MYLKVKGMDKCDECGFTTSCHLVHTKEGKCYCTRHYLMHILHDSIEEYKIKKAEC
jgi:hypothetical protein